MSISDVKFIYLISSHELQQCPPYTQSFMTDLAKSSIKLFIWQVFAHTVPYVLVEKNGHPRFIIFSWVSSIYFLNKQTLVWNFGRNGTVNLGNTDKHSTFTIMIESFSYPPEIKKHNSSVLMTIFMKLYRLLFWYRSKHIVKLD